MFLNLFWHRTDLVSLDILSIIDCKIYCVKCKKICKTIYVFSSPEPPELLLEMGMPRELKAMAGTLIKIVAGIKGQPFPKVTWTKNDAELPPRVETETSAVRAKLEMRYCNRGDCGNYTLTIENPAGTKTATCTVLVLGKHFSKCRCSKQNIQQ